MLPSSASIGRLSLLSLLPSLALAAGCGSTPGVKTPSELATYARTPGSLACETTTTHVLNKQTTRTCDDIAETSVHLDSSICKVEKKSLTETKFLDGSCPLTGALAVCIHEINDNSGTYWINRTYYYYKEDGALICGSSNEKWVTF